MTYTEADVIRLVNLATDAIAADKGIGMHHPALELALAPFRPDPDEDEMLVEAMVRAGLKVQGIETFLDGLDEKVREPFRNQMRAALATVKEHRTVLPLDYT